MSSVEADPATVVILGAYSAIGEATARAFAREHAKLVLVGRDANKLEDVARNLEALGATVAGTHASDLAAPGDAIDTFSQMVANLGGSVDAVYLFYGVLGDQEKSQSDLDELRQILTVNFTSAAEWAMAAANQLELQGCGSLIAISSVAGDRGRQSNYAYGAAKAGLSVFMQGIAHRLAPCGANAITVKLGFVDTPMTAHIKKGGPLWAKPEAVAERLKSLSKTGGKPVVYIPSFWRPIMMLIRATPAPIFHRTKL